MIKPRNHLARYALFRKAGAHKKSNKATRRAEKTRLLRELSKAIKS